MAITGAQLKQIIKEELEKVLAEGTSPARKEQLKDQAAKLKADIEQLNKDMKQNEEDLKSVDDELDAAHDSKDRAGIERTRRKYKKLYAALNKNKETKKEKEEQLRKLGNTIAHRKQS